MDELTDDEAIATALLMGCTFWAHPSYPDEFFVHSDADNLHPLEHERIRTTRRDHIEPWPSKAALARDYIKFTLESNDGA